MFFLPATKVLQFSDIGFLAVCYLIAKSMPHTLAVVAMPISSLLEGRSIPVKNKPQCLLAVRKEKFTSFLSYSLISYRFVLVE